MLAQTALTREDFAVLDREDCLAAFRHGFDLPEHIIYLDGNSLGAPPRTTRGRLDGVVARDWRNDLNASWWKHRWLDLPRGIGDKIARIIGAEEGEVIVTDSTSVNLFKLLMGALDLRPERRVILSDRSNFPGDLYVAQGVARAQKRALRIVAPETMIDALDEDVAVVTFSQVDFRSGRLMELRPVVERAHAVGALVLCDLSHSAGVLPLQLGSDGVDLAVGCGYKFLNGGPGAPSFLYAAKRLVSAIENPIWGWLGHPDAFAFEPEYRPDPSIARFLAGCPPLLSLVALEEGIDLLLEADLGAVRRKSLALTGRFIDLARQECGGDSFEIVSPLDGRRRGSQVTLRHPSAARIVRALAESGVIAEFRAPDLIRFGFAPLYVSFADIWDSIAALKRVLHEVGSDRGALPRSAAQDVREPVLERSFHQGGAHDGS
jgi:kynureninase